MRTLFFYFFLFCQLTILAQPIFNEEHFSSSNGIRSIVQGALQDSQGYLWFATWSGLEKYDGYSFKGYKSRVGDGSTLTNNRIVSVQEGWNRNLWCHTYDDRAFLFDVHKEFFLDVLAPIEQTMKRKNTIQDIYPLPKGVTWIVCSDGYSYRVNERQLNKKKGIHYFGTYDGSLRGDIVYKVFQDIDGDEWILTDKGISIYGKKKIEENHPFKYYCEKGTLIWLVTNTGYIACYDKRSKQIKSHPSPYPIGEVTSFTILRDETLAMGTDVGLVLYSNKSGDFSKSDFSTTNNPIMIEGEDRKGNIWFTDKGRGINRYNRSTRQSSKYFTLEEYLPETERTGGSFFHEDSNGNIIVWPRYGVLGYYNEREDKLVPIVANGSLIDMKIFYFDKQGNLWHSDQHNLGKLTLFNRIFLSCDYGSEVRTLFIDKLKRIWFASKDGYIRLENEHQKSIGYLNAKGIISPEKVKFGANIYCIIQEPDGTIWMGLRNEGLVVLKPNSPQELSYKISRYKEDRHNPFSISDNSIYSILRDHKGRIWIGTYGGGLNLICNKEDITHLKFINKENTLMPYPKNSFSKIRNLFEAKNVIFVCTTDGILTYSSLIDNVEKIKFFENKRSPYRIDGLSNNNVMRMFQDRQKNLYAIEYGGGFSKLLSKNCLTNKLIFKTYDEHVGLLSDLTLSMVEDNKGYLWILMEKGISKFDPRKEVFINFKNDFFMDNFSISEGNPIVDNRGHFWIGTDKGILSFSPMTLNKRNFVPQIVFTEVKSQNEMLKGYRYDYNILEIEPSERSFSIQFAALDYASSDEINYAYRLKGGDNEWHYVGTSREANYINVPHGEYQFEVKSTNGDGVWCNNIRTLKIVVKPTFSETHWIWILYALSFFLLISSIVYILFYIYRLRHQVNIEQQLTDVKLRFFTDISHELRTPLTLIGGPIDEVLEHEQLSDKSRNYLSVAKNNSDRMLRLINQILDFRKIQNKKMKVLVEEVEVISFLSKIVNNFSSIAKEHHLHYVFDPEIDKQIIWADRDKLEKIFYNLISNAFKYTPEGRSIIIVACRDKQTLQIRVIDEGIGISTAKFSKLFQRFETLANQNIMQPSSGIGLSLVKEFVELHHATINVKSSVGKGSEFIVTFLLGKAHFLNDPRAEFILNDSKEYINSQIIYDESKKDGENKDVEKLSILIVEDNKELLSFLKNVLCNVYTVIEATNGEEGLKLASENIPDIIITDIMMPIMDGMEMIKKIKEDKNICHIPIIILTAKASLDDQIAGIKSGIDDYLVKPFSASYLEARIVSLLAQRKQLQDRYIQMLPGEKEASKDILKLSKPQISNYDEEFINKVMNFIEKNIEKSNLTIDEFASYLNMSRTVFYRKLKAITGLSPIEFIMKMRINRAAQLIEDGKLTFSQIAYISGFTDPKYFSKCFKRFKNMTPSEYKDQYYSENPKI